MGESRKTELFLNGALSSPHCSFLGIKYGKITFCSLCVLLRSYSLKILGVN